MANNTYYTSTGSVTECGAKLADWQKQGNDGGSEAAIWPTDAALTALAAAKLGIN